MTLIPRLSPVLMICLAGCLSVSDPRQTLVDMSDLPPELPRSAVADLDPDVQRQINRGLDAIERRLGPVCTAQQVAEAKEALVLFGWATTSTISNPPMQAYAQRRGPQIRAARQTLSPACDAEVDALVKTIRQTQE